MDNTTEIKKYNYNLLYFIMSASIFLYFDLNILTYSLLFKILYNYQNKINVEEALTYILIYYFIKHFLIIFLLFAGIFLLSMFKPKLQIYIFNFTVFAYYFDKLNTIMTYYLCKIGVVELIIIKYNQIINNVTNILDIYFNRELLMKIMYEKFIKNNLNQLINFNELIDENPDSENSGLESENPEDENCINNLLKKEN
jgi:hypothetical protein